MQLTTALRIEYASTPDKLLDQSRCAVDAGFDGVELSPPLSWSSTEASPNDVLYALSRGEGAKIAAIAASVAATDIAAARDELVSLLELAAVLGARCLNLAIPSAVQPTEGVGYYRSAVTFAYQLLSRCRLDAEAAGVAVGLESAAGGCFVSPVELREFIDAVNSWSVGACLDVHHIGRPASLADWVLTLTHRVHTVRLHDMTPPSLGDAEARDTALEWKRLGEALDEARYDRLVVISGDGAPKDLLNRLAELDHGASAA